MTLINRTLAYFSAILLVILSVWAALFYFEMLDEVYDSLDDGLDNYKTIIIQKAYTDSSILQRTQFAESNYSIHEIRAETAFDFTDTYKDTLLYMQNEADYEPVRLLNTVFALNGKYYELKVISSMVEEDDLIEDLLYSLLWLYLGLLAVILLVNNLLLKQIWKPFYKVLEQVRSFKLGKENNFTPAKTNIKEFKALNKAVDDFIKNSTETYNSQKQFIENASHELQTPLAISINKLELLAENPEMDKEALQAIGSVLDNLERLTRLNKSLLLLSKIENRQFASDGMVDMNLIIAKQVANFEDFAAYKKITVSVSSNSSLQAILNKDLAEILVSNLLKNAIVHNIYGGRVEIIIDAKALTISNTGTPAPLNEKQIFNRFYKESDQKNTTGLGLAIIKAIADAYGYTLNYSYKTGQHSMGLKL